MSTPIQVQVTRYACPIRSINADAELPDDWAPRTAEQLTAAAQEYLGFAIEKISAHRGISAERSVIKLREYAWLLDRDDVVTAMDAAEYPQYGAPTVKAFADGMGWPFIAHVAESERAALVRMSKGLPCVDGCESGCGR